MWLIRMAGWISASTLTLIFFGLRWLEWFFWGCDFYAAISILSLLLRAGVTTNNRTALWIESHSPRLIRQLGMLMSRTMAVRLLFWIALVTIGYQFRDYVAYQEFVDRPHLHWKVLRHYPARHYPGTAFDVQILPEGMVIQEIIPCPPQGWYDGMEVDAAGYYDLGDCISFHGPQAYISIVRKEEPQ